MSLPDDMLSAKEVAAVLGVRVRAVYLLPIPRNAKRGSRWSRQSVMDYMVQARSEGAVQREKRRWVAAARFSDNPTIEASITPEAIRKNKALFPYSGPAVYFLFKGDELVYIGQTVNLLNRVSSHFGRKDFDHFSYIKCDRADLNELERRAIVRYQPKLNRIT